jgi:apolipoprotein D and lipocalin family protein
LTPRIFAFALLLAAAPAFAADAPIEQKAVPAVDLARYMGAWHEISHIPNFAQKGCTDTIVNYRLAPDGGFELLNTCWKGEKYKPYHGWAKPWEKGATSKFHVKFFAIFGSDYWIIDLDPDYKWAAVGTSKRDQLWVISRERELDGKIYQGILDRARAQGYDVAKLERTVVTGKTSKGFEP